MKKQGTQKGEYGYLRSRRIRSSIIIAVLLGIALTLYFGARTYFGTNQNWFTIFAILVCLPAAREIVNLVMLLKAKGCSESLYRTIGSMRLPQEGLFSLYMTSEKKNFDLSHVFFANHCVIALTEDPACDCSAGEQHIRRMMQQNNFHGWTVKIFRDRKAYCTRLDQLENSAGTESEDAPRKAELRQLLLNISL